jgi:hypothetical protein
MCYTLIKEYWYSDRAMPIIYFFTIAISLIIFYNDYQLALYGRMSLLPPPCPLPLIPCWFMF